MTFTPEQAARAAVVLQSSAVPIFYNARLVCETLVNGGSRIICVLPDGSEHQKIFKPSEDFRPWVESLTSK